MASKKLRVISYPWHTSHQHYLTQLKYWSEYCLLRNPYRFWALTQRPEPPKVKYVNYYEPGKYDLAILHIDQQALWFPEDDDRYAKGRLYYEVNQLIKDIPKIVINHMTPFHDKYDGPEIIRRIKRLIGDNIMVVNSYEAAKQWGWGYTIIHGMKPEDWWDLPKEPRVVVALSQAGMEKAYRRIFLHQVIRKVKELKVPFVWIGVDKKFNTWDDYRDFLGRSLVYFNPTWQSPRPRARTEAMLSGCCVVTTPYQDADTFIEDGVNGFLTSKALIKDPRVMDNPDYTARLLRRLVFDEPELALKVGQEGKKTALKLFNFKRFEEQWGKLLKKIGVL